MPFQCLTVFYTKRKRSAKFFTKCLSNGLRWREKRFILSTSSMEEGIFFSTTICSRRSSTTATSRNVSDIRTMMLSVSSPFVSAAGAFRRVFFNCLSRGTFCSRSLEETREANIPIARISRDGLEPSCLIRYSSDFPRTFYGITEVLCFVHAN